MGIGGGDDVDDDVDDDDDNSGGRQLSSGRTSGELEVLVVRVTDASGEEPRLDRHDISNRVFGTFGDMGSLKSQMGACSGDQLKLTPSTRDDDDENNIRDGVLELSIDVNVSDFDNSQRKFLEKAVNNKLKTEGYSVRSCE